MYLGFLEPNGLVNDSYYLENQMVSDILNAIGKITYYYLGKGWREIVQKKAKLTSEKNNIQINIFVFISRKNCTTNYCVYCVKRNITRNILVFIFSFNTFKLEQTVISDKITHTHHQ